MPLEFLMVGIGGFCGSCIRFFLTKVTNLLHLSFPLGTLFSNLIAGFFIGLIIMFEQQTSGLSSEAKLFLTTGLMGGLSTFSTFSLETVTFFQNGKYLLAISNILLNLSLSLISVIAGMYFAGVIFPEV